jgi:hypothetical protein
MVFSVLDDLVGSALNKLEKLEEGLNELAVAQEDLQKAG